ncbi:MAG: hypothetical protein H6668_02025 [Ardenticatenaceae bacterium]|nr:hypothetical protein [Ardenticatenaceae bacterium]
MPSLHFNIVELAALALINIHWLISIHTTGAMATCSLSASLGWTASLWVLPCHLRCLLGSSLSQRYTLVR